MSSKIFFICFLILLSFVLSNARPDRTTRGNRCRTQKYRYFGNNQEKSRGSDKDNELKKNVQLLRNLEMPSFGFGLGLGISRSFNGLGLGLGIGSSIGS